MKIKTIVHVGRMWVLGGGACIARLCDGRGFDRGGDGEFEGCDRALVRDL